MYLNTNKFIISEIGSNHNANLKRCYRLIDQSKKVGCDAVKFQYFTVDTLFRESALKKFSFNEYEKMGITFRIYSKNF